MKRTLGELLVALDDFKESGPVTVQVKNIVDDSRKTEKGSLFVAIKGLTFDAHKFIPQAISSGTVAVVGEIEPKKSWFDKITYVKVPDSRRALGLLASAWYNHPSKNLKIIGVTGTDGKTTTANIIYWILNKASKKVGLVSTISAKIGKKELDTGVHVTNPEPLPLQKFLAKMVDARCKYAVLEVTSHGLDQERVAGVDFDVAVLTNITHEHFDYHKTYANYVKAKAKLFKSAKVPILNKDDDSYKGIRKFLGSKVKVVDYDRKALRGSLKSAVGHRFPEQYNQMNATAATVVVRQLGVKETDIVNAIKTFPGLPGRMQEIRNKKGIKVIVDFAHTPNALESVLSALRKNKKKGKRLIAVFGCAGERDVAKRPMMAKISTNLADISVFTAEDPRSENVNDILEEMAKAALGKGAREFKLSKTKELKDLRTKEHVFFRIPERGEAVAFAIQKLAKKGDTVVVCGKGHEKSMAYDGIEYPWSDAEAVRVALGGGVTKIKRK